MQRVTVTIASREYEIEERLSLANAEWRKSLVDQYGTFIHDLLRASETKVSTPEGMAQLSNLVGELVTRLGGSIEDLRDRVIDYSPVLQRDRDYLVENGYDSEFLGAFMGVVKLAYPFGGLSQLVQGLTKRLGERKPQTSKNSL